MPAGTTEVDVTLASSHTFPSDSPERRYYLSSAPEAVCQDGAYLYRYRNYGFISDVANLKAALPTNRAGGRTVLAFPLQAGSMTFRFQNPTLARSGLVAFEYVLQHPTRETLSMGQQVRLLMFPRETDSSIRAARLWSANGAVCYYCACCDRHGNGVMQTTSGQSSVPYSGKRAFTLLNQVPKRLLMYCCLRMVLPDAPVQLPFFTATYCSWSADAVFPSVVFR